jgi:uncharacterized protein YndB with AHSA1/START domain
MSKTIVDKTRRTLTLKRTFGSHLELVWICYTQPEYILKWWSPEGMETKIINYDFNVGSNWKYIMSMPNGLEFTAEGTFREIVNHEKVVSEANFKPKTEGVVLEVFFEKDERKTNFTFNVIHPTEAYKLEQEKLGVLNGWDAAFDRLAELLWNLT